MSSVSAGLLYFQPWNIAAIFLGLALYYFYINLVNKRQILNAKLPGNKAGVFDILADGKFLKPKEIPQDLQKYPTIYALQYLAGSTHLFRNDTFFTIWLGYVPFVVIVKARAAEELIGGARHLEKSWIYSLVHDWMSLGLLTSPPEKWRIRRKLIAPCFHLDILKDFLPIMNEKSKYLVDEVLKKETDKDWTDIAMPVSLCALDVILETSMGVKMNAQENSKSEYVQVIMRVTHIFASRFLSPHYLVNPIFYASQLGRQFTKDVNLLKDFTLKVIKEKKEKLKLSETTTKRKALMDMLLEHNLQHGDLSEEDIREEVDTFTFTGHDTTAVGMCWTLYLIGLNKDIQNRIHEDIDRIFGDDTERPITMDDLKEMEYLERVIKESLRLFPSVPLWGRQSSTNTVLNGHKIPKGIACLVFTYGLHRDPEEFPNPEKFDPDRFLPENSANRHPYAYMPFSFGPRNCVGQRYALMQEKVVVTNVLRNFTVESLEPRDKVLPAPDTAIRNSEPVKLRIRKRIRGT